MTRTSFLLLCLAATAFGEVFSVGVRVGAAVSNMVRTAGEIGNQPFVANTQRFTAGPVLRVRLPLGLGFEMGAMYKRFHQEAGQVTVIDQPGVPYQVQSSPYARTGSSFELPFLGQYRFGGRAIEPYIEAGASFNRLGGVLGPFRTLVNGPAVLTPAALTQWRTGFVAGAGIAIKLPRVHLLPGIRYTRYDRSQSWLPSANSVDVLLGVTL